MAGQGKSAVYLAMVGNGFLTICKFVAFVLSGSGAMMSEAVHSFADTANQALLYIGIKRSQRPADDAYHYGYGADRYVFALMSAMGIFVLGCGVTVYHGVHSLLNPSMPNVGWLTFVVLALAFVIDGYVLMRAVQEVNQQRGKKGLLRFIQESTDPTLIAVLFEDFVATLGVIVALAGIALTQITGDPMYDALSSIAIGLLLGLLAMWLGWRNRVLVLGPSIPDEKAAQIRAYLEEQPTVTKVREMRTRIVAADRFRIAAEVDYDGTSLGAAQSVWAKARAAACSSDEEWQAFSAEFGDRIVEALGVEVDRIEAELVERFPLVQDIDIEAD